MRLSHRICGLLIVSCWLLASGVRGGEKVTVAWSVRDAAVTAARGQTVEVELTTPIPAGWHIYTTKTYGDKGPALAPTTFTAKPDTLVTIAGPITYPAPKLIKLEGFDVEVFEKSATFTVPLQVRRDAPPGTHTVTLTVDSQLCSESACVPQFDKTVSITLKVTEAVADEPPAPAVAPESPAASGPTRMPGGEWFGTREEIERARQQGLLAYLWFSLSMGAAALLTPCVFPMVPITVSFFTKRKHTSRARAVRSAAVYALGIICTFILLGFLFTLLLGATGITDFAANPWVNLFIAAVFVVFALSLFGAFEIQLPSFIVNRLSAAARQGEGIGSVLLMGLVFSLTSFTCTVPFVGASLFSATQGQWTWPLVGMFGFATAFASPFFVLALFPSLLHSLPKSGGWMNSVKVVTGFLELAAAMKFLSNADLVWHWAVLKREVFLSIWIALAALTAVYLLGRIRFSHETQVESIGAIRALLGTGFLALGIWLSTGLAGRALGSLDAYVPPKQYPGEQAGVELAWLEDWDAALVEGKNTGKPLFADFSGYTCTNCRWMETNIFPRPEIAPLLRDFVRVRLYTDGRKDAGELARSRRTQSLQETRYQTTALPFYAVVGPDGKDIATFPGLTRNVEQFAAFLKAGLAGNAQLKAPKAR